MYAHIFSVDHSVAAGGTTILWVHHMCWPHAHFGNQCMYLMGGRLLRPPHQLNMYLWLASFTCIHLVLLDYSVHTSDSFKPINLTAIQWFFQHPPMQVGERTALHHAAMSGMTEVVGKMLERGADANIQDIVSLTVLWNLYNSTTLLL